MLSFFTRISAGQKPKLSPKRWDAVTFCLAELMAEIFGLLSLLAKRLPNAA
jgi:hypothetical protein